MSARNGCVVWLTGLSGAGKTTVAQEVRRRLEAVGRAVEHLDLDGDAVRAVFPTGFSRAERHEHVRRMGYIAGLLERHGVIVVAAFISPYRESRLFARANCRRFLEVHVSTPLAVCEERDCKGLYARARRGELSGFTGIDDPYEAPESPELLLDLSRLSVGEGADSILALVDGGG